MKKKEIITVTGILLLIVSMSTFADLGAVHSEASGDPSLQRFVEENNLPQPGSGIQIIPFSQSSFANEKKFLIDFESMKKTGYKKQPSDDAKFLLHVQKNKYYPGNKETYENSDPQDTHIKASLAQIKLAFPFHGISFLPNKDVLGFAVSGGWENGWTGVTEIFLYEDIGICSYNRSNAVLNHSAIRLVKEFVTYDVNSKPTQVFASGQDDEGYSYKVSWYDNDFYHTLICAKPKFSKEAKVNAITLAKKIDLDLQ
jgi:hypothetical protein